MKLIADANVLLSALIGEGVRGQQVRVFKKDFEAPTGVRLDPRHNPPKPTCS